MSQAKKGPLMPLERQGEAILVGPWLADHLGRKLQGAEAQTFGNAVLRAWNAHRRHNRLPKAPPYTIRVGSENSQITAYLPEDETILLNALEHYKRFPSYKRIQDEIDKEKPNE